MSLWIFDYDQTLMPSYISNIINNNNITINNINNIIIILINMIIIINYITKELKGKIIILTASTKPWVEISIIKAENIIKKNKELINYDIIKDYVINYNYNKIKNIINTENFFSIYIYRTITNIIYVHNIEQKLNNNNEKYDKKRSLEYIIQNYNKYNNIIILGDAYDNERKYTIEISQKYNNKLIKFIQFHNTYNNIIKIHEQHLLFNNLKKIYNINKKVIFDI